MTETPETEDGQAATPRRTSARIEPSRWPGWVWAIPIAAILVAGWLALQGFATRGETVTVSFDTAVGLEAGQTQVNYKGLEVGVVKALQLQPNGRIVAKIHMHSNVRPLLRTHTMFWIVGAKPSITDIASLKAAVSGAVISMQPGPGEPANHFMGLDEPPPIPPGTPGSAFTLVADRLGPVQEGSPIFYRGIEAGKITSYTLTASNEVRIGAFINAPFDRLVRTHSQFWVQSPLRITTGAGGLEAQIASPQAVLTGAVTFDNLKTGQDAGPQAEGGDSFVLYSDQNKAEVAPTGSQIAYGVDFRDPVGDLQPGAPVQLRGFPIGRVTMVGFHFDPASGTLQTPVTIMLYPDAMHLPVGGRAPLDDMLRKLVGRGMRAKLVQSPPLVGSRIVSLDFDPTATGGALGHRAELLTIPSSSSGELSDVVTEADAVMRKVNRLPIAEIGENLRALTTRLRTLTDSPKVDDSLDHLDSTLANVDEMVKTAKPQVEPLIASLRSAADQLQGTAAAAGQLVSGQGAPQGTDLPSAIKQLNEAARSVRSLADYLGRHPEALVRGKTGDAK
ncbi:intermembrane transport protein PqiB [Caulobacter sp. S45]|uniref:PqiB family protein n=1 Tax=Caulobacter sp. S45 TaxID=1641861 RepID=UPI00131CBE29|nr:MlaD family protein [Caulobacter sp. S45]